MGAGAGAGTAGSTPQAAVHAGRKAMHCGAFVSPNRADEPACSPAFRPSPCPPAQVMDFAERMRAAEAEKEGLEAEIQVVGPPCSHR